MARIRVFFEKAPIPIKVGEKTVWICNCGLTDNYPFCDGSHKHAKDEQPGLYKYEKTENGLIRKKISISYGKTPSEEIDSESGCE